VSLLHGLGNVIQLLADNKRLVERNVCHDDFCLPVKCHVLEAVIKEAQNEFL
jgi:hypothetical protein